MILRYVLRRRGSYLNHAGRPLARKKEVSVVVVVVVYLKRDFRGEVTAKKATRKEKRDSSFHGSRVSHDPKKFHGWCG